MVEWGSIQDFSADSCPLYMALFLMLKTRHIRDMYVG